MSSVKLSSRQKSIKEKAVKHLRTTNSSVQLQPKRCRGEGEEIKLERETDVRS